MTRRLGTMAALCAFGAALGGCAIVGKDYERPALVLPETHAVELASGDARSAANTAWFELYDDPELRPLIEEALDDNLDLQQAFARIEEVRARLLVARSGFFPRVDGSLSTGAQPQANSNDAVFTLGLVLGWEIDLFGRIRRQNEAARAQLLATEASRAAIVTTVVQQVAATFLTIREIQAEEAILARNIALQERALDLVELLHRQGVVSDSEVQQATAQLAGTRSLLPQVVQARLVSENLLTVLLGRYPSEIGLSPFDAERQARGIGAYDLPLGVPSALLARRPDVIAAEQQLAAATAIEGVAIANRFPFPTIGLGSLLGRTSTELGSLFDDGASSSLNSWGPEVRLPILNFGRDLGNVRAARAQVDQALIGYRRAVQGALFDVNAAVYAYRAGEAQIEPLADQLAAAERTLFLQNLRFRGGVVNYLSVLDAQRLVLSSELALARARLQRDLAFVDLYRALGGGWSPEDTPDIAVAAGTGEPR
ncbi:efflux transporter outer membrane subunit [Erythrobacter sp.]|uniref:efflux transporter outer membrane subunit n=1 Tax=Erythrobacter sp. TaxID=1042 RepID=UPI002ECFA89A|nr:efflux transporter outer membrane subunit [Erythrobacter sp.]